MKNISLYLAIAAFFIAVFLGCKKQQTEISSLQVQQMDQTSQDIEQRILQFKEQLNSNLKDEEEYKISEAVYNLEALVNYEYADVANNLMGLDIDSVFISVTLTNGKVTISEAGSVYDKIIDSLTVKYNNLPIMSTDIIGDIHLIDPNYKYVHYMINTYGVWVANSNDPGTFE